MKAPRKTILKASCRQIITDAHSKNKTKQKKAMALDALTALVSIRSVLNVLSEVGLIIDVHACLWSLGAHWVIQRPLLFGEWSRMI